jgi:hypothetical protein
VKDCGHERAASIEDVPPQVTVEKRSVGADHTVGARDRRLRVGRMIEQLATERR